MVKKFREDLLKNFGSGLYSLILTLILYFTFCCSLTFHLFLCLSSRLYTSLSLCRYYTLFLTVNFHLSYSLIQFLLLDCLIITVPVAVFLFLSIYINLVLLLYILSLSFSLIVELGQYSLSTLPLSYSLSPSLSSTFPFEQQKLRSKWNFAQFPSQGAEQEGSGGGGVTFFHFPPLLKWRLCLCRCSGAVRGRRIWPSWTGHRCPVSALTKSKEALQESKRAQRTSPRDEESPQLHLFPPPLTHFLHCCSRSCSGFVFSCSAACSPFWLVQEARRNGRGGWEGGVAALCMQVDMATRCQ